MSTFHGWRRWSLLVALSISSAGCVQAPYVATARTWVVATAEPAFDPDGPPNTLRWAIERLLTRGLVERDTTGDLVPVAAEAWGISADSLTWTFRLRPGLRYTDGTLCTSGDFKRALVAGLGRTDHSTRAWILAAVRGVDRVRAGKPLPEIGIETPDSSTLVIRLERRDPLLLEKLAIPGAATPWKHRMGPTWKNVVGIGRYRMQAADSVRRMVLLRAPGETVGPDTIQVRFGVPPGRVRALMRQARADLAWPLPPGLLDEPLPAGYRRVTQVAVPPRRLLLVMRADLPPTTRLPARSALAHSLNRSELLRALEPYGNEVANWFEGAGRFEFPRLDRGEVMAWMERGHLGRSFHVSMAYDADGVAAAIARSLQGEWARYLIYVELLPLRGPKLETETLTGRSHLLLIESQALLDHPAGELATLVMPVRGPAVGEFRTGWRTREFDAFVLPPEAPPPLAQVQRRLEEERVVLPLVRLPWMWVESEATGPITHHPAFGPDPGAPVIRHPGSNRR